MYQLKSMAALPNVYGSTFTGDIYNKEYNLIRLHLWTAVCRRNAFLNRFFAQPVSRYEGCTLTDFHTTVDKYP